MNRTRSDGGSPLNRLSWLRSSHSFLNAIAASPNARWLVLNAGQQLVSVPTSNTSERPAIAQLTTSQVKSFLGPEPWFGQGKDDGRTLSPDEVISFTESARHRGVRIVFLGLLDTLSTSNALPTSDFTDPERAVANLEGTPYFALDIGELGVDTEAFLDEHKDTQILSWGEARPLMMGLQLDKVSLALFTVGRSMVDWNQRNKVFGSFHYHFGSPTDLARSFAPLAVLRRTLSGEGGRSPARLCFHGQTTPAESRVQQGTPTVPSRFPR